MARQEHDREDMLAEATALHERVELQLADGGQVFIGFRRDGGASVYFAGDPVYQFNAQAELRRAFVDGRMYKAEQRRLVQLTRERQANEVWLVRHELSDAETYSLLDALSSRLSTLREALAAGSYQLVGQVPTEDDVLSRVRNWLEAQPLPPALAASPRAQ